MFRAVAGECVIAGRILILLHESDPFPDGPSYFIWGLRDAWLELGLDVVVAKGLAELRPADLVIPHIDLTTTPREYRATLESLTNVVNAGCYDISKRRISSQLVQPGDGWDGPVIVKTNQNCGGKPDRRVELLDRSLRKRISARLWRTLSRKPPPSAVRLAAERGEYTLYDTSAHVSTDVLSDPALVVERFLPEREGDAYFVRWYIFVGDRYRSMRVGAPDPLVKLAGVTSRQVGLPVPDEVVAFRRRFGLDFGKIDFVVHEGTPVILDLNRTPADQPPPERLAICRPYAPGVLSLLQGRRPDVTEYRDVDR